jgi:hypothetical protein
LLVIWKLINDSFAASEAREIVDNRAKKVGGYGTDKAAAEGADSINQLFRVVAPDVSLEPTYLRTLEIQERYGTAEEN